MTRMSIAEEAAQSQARHDEMAKQGHNLHVMEEDFLRRFWDEKVGFINHPDIVPVRVNREHFLYHRSSQEAKGPFTGFGGRRWYIEFFDGTKVTTNNLWYQGEIPTDYDDLLPDNARFVEK